MANNAFCFFSVIAYNYRSVGQRQSDNKYSYTSNLEIGVRQNLVQKSQSLKLAQKVVMVHGTESR